MQTVADILEAKRDPAVFTVRPDSSVFDAIALMNEKRIGALVVVEADAVVGIVTERDFTRKLVLSDRASGRKAVREVMTTPVIHVTREQTAEDCMLLMGSNHLRHLPVLEGAHLVGMVSIRDLVNDIIASL